MPPAVLKFGAFELDCDCYELRRTGRAVKLEKMPMELLILLAQSNGRLVTRSEIVTCLWGGKVFVDTEHGTNTAVRKLRQALGDDPDNPRFVQTVTGKGYRFIASVAAPPGLPGAVLLHSPSENETATTLELTTAPADPLEIKPPPLESPSDPPLAASPVLPPRSPNLPRPHRILVRFAVLAGIAVLATILVAAAALDRSRPHLGRIAGPRVETLAVLPLDNLSGDPAQDYFADGLTDELITMLAKNSNLHIVSRTSVMQYKGVHRPIRDIARELGADAILEGSVARSGSAVHMNIQLIHAPTDTHLWAESYDRDAKTVASLPGEAARTIAHRLDHSVPGHDAQSFVRPEAHDAYLRGRYFWFAHSNDKAGEYFNKATALQPDYALGWSGLADFYCLRAINGEAPPSEVLPLQEAAARKAVELDDSLPEAHNSMSAVYLLKDWNLERADAESVRALELNPNYAEAHHLHAKILMSMNRMDQAFEEQKRSTELDPFARSWAMMYQLMNDRHFDAALKEGLLRLEASPQAPTFHGVLSQVYWFKGMKKEAAEEFEKYLSLSGDQPGARAVHLAFEQGGYTAVNQLQLQQLHAKAAHQYVSPMVLARIYAQLGNREETIRSLNQALEEHASTLIWIQYEPVFDFVHADPRYRSVVKRVGLDPAY